MNDYDEYIDYKWSDNITIGSVASIKCINIDDWVHNHVSNGIIMFIIAIISICDN